MRRSLVMSRVGSRIGMRFIGSFCLSAALLLHAVNPAAGEPDTIQRLQRMARALETVNYEGTVVYLHDNRLETLHIAHRVEHGRVLEKLISLNGPPRSVTREMDQVTCEFPHAQTLSVKRRVLGQNLLAARAIDPEALSEHYTLHLLGNARVAGRHTDVIGIIPTDHFRYGYRFFLDRESGLPLKFDLIGQEVEPILQIMFTSLTLLPPPEYPAEVTPEVSLEATTAPEKSSNQTSWRLKGLPPGFRLIMHDGWQDDQGVYIEHFLVSDGLASVSLYIESGQSAGLAGSSRIGAVHAAGAIVAGHQVTVVGEVPEMTIAAVMASIAFAGDTND